MVTGCCKSDKSCYIYRIRLKGLLVKYEKYKTVIYIAFKKVGGLKTTATKTGHNAAIAYFLICVGR